MLRLETVDVFWTLKQADMLNSKMIEIPLTFKMVEVYLTFKTVEYTRVKKRLKRA